MIAFMCIVGMSYALQRLHPRFGTTMTVCVHVWTWAHLLLKFGSDIVADLFRTKQEGLMHNVVRNKPEYCYTTNEHEMHASCSESAKVLI